MGNIMPLAEGEVAPHGAPEVHGMVYRLSNADFATLTNMEHEYLCDLPNQSPLLAAIDALLLPCLEGICWPLCLARHGLQVCTCSAPSTAEHRQTVTMLAVISIMFCAKVPQSSVQIVQESVLLDRPTELIVQTQRGPVAAIAFVTPPSRLISDGLPPPSR